MRRFFPVRLLAITALAGSGTLAVALPGGSASAKAAKPPKVICTAISGGEVNVVNSGCSGDPALGTFGNSVTNSTQNGSTITWASGATSTSSFTIKALVGKKDKCPAVPGETPLAEAKEKGSVTSGTALVGGKVKATVCAYSGPGGVTVSLLPGTSYAI